MLLMNSGAIQNRAVAPFAPHPSCMYNGWHHGKSDRTFEPFVSKMKAEKMPNIVIDNFKFYYNRMAGGETGHFSETGILLMVRCAFNRRSPCAMQRNR
jgi:hypothetical protein